MIQRPGAAGINALDLYYSAFALHIQRKPLGTRYAELSANCG